jgi:8-oxo-dGTP diphosphatase
LKTIHVVGAIIIEREKALAAQRGYGSYAGWWEFPGGKVEPDESPEDALAREIREELKANISIDRYFDTTEYDYPEFHLSMRCYLCSLGGDHLTPVEHSALKWVGREEIRNLKWLGADLPIIDRLIDDGII